MITVHHIDHAGRACQRCGADLTQGVTAPLPAGEFLMVDAEPDSRFQAVREFDARPGEMPCSHRA